MFEIYYRFFENSLYYCITVLLNKLLYWIFMSNNYYKCGCIEVKVNGYVKRIRVDRDRRRSETIIFPSKHRRCAILPRYFTPYMLPLLSFRGEPLTDNRMNELHYFAQIFNWLWISFTKAVSLRPSIQKLMTVQREESKKPNREMQRKE